MPDLFDLITRWWKKITFIVIASLLLAATVALLKPKKYLSIATAVPASAFASDKGNIFNADILYTFLNQYTHNKHKKDKFENDLDILSPY